METISASGLVDQVFLRCVEDCSEPIMLTDKKGVLCYVNPAWVLTYGYEKTEAIGQTPRILRSEGQASDFYQKMWQTISDPATGFWRGEVLNRAKDGHLVYVLLTITPYREATGLIVGYMGIAVDLSEQKKMEQQILRQDRLASIGMLAGGLAHEIGNPLGVIRGRAELAMQQVKGNAVAEQNLEIVIGQIDRISGLIQSLLRVSRVPEQILLRETDLYHSVQEAFLLTSEACRQAGVDLRLRNLDDKVYAEPSHLQQLLLNLIINSLHAIEEQKIRNPQSDQIDFIEVSSELTGNGRCVVAVNDTGCGISSENMKKLFQPFYTTKSAGRGTGLGLAIVSKLIEEVNGRVWVESPGIGLGATFKLEFQTVKV
jgi:PAS domain S-box-containing protein